MFVVVNDEGYPFSIETDEEKAKEFAGHIYGSYFEAKSGVGKFTWFHGTNEHGEPSTWEERTLFKRYLPDEEFVVRDSGSFYARALTKERCIEILNTGGLLPRSET